MYKTILVPIDLAHAEKGKPMIKLARRLGNENARIILINVIEDVPAFISAQLPVDLTKQIHETAGEELKAIANAAGIKPDYEVASGKANNAILDIAEQQDADLIIIGSHKPGLQDYLLGSTAARVVRHAKCSVLVSR